MKVTISESMFVYVYIYICIIYISFTTSKLQNFQHQGESMAAVANMAINGTATTAIPEVADAAPKAAAFKNRLVGFLRRKPVP